MPTDFTSTDNDPIAPDSEAPMFAPTPSWDRSKKQRRGMFGGTTRAASEPRTFDAEPVAATAAGADVLASEARPYESRMDFVEPTDIAFAATPVYAATPARRGNGAAPIAIAAGVILLGGLAAAGWYASQPHDQGIAQLTPGSTTTTTTAETAAPIAPPQMAQTAPTPPAMTHSTTTTRTVASAAPVRSHAPVARARTSSRSAAEVGSDASARASAPVQAAPMPAPATPAPAAATPAPPLVLNLPAAPAPTQAAPPAATAPAPTQTPPN